MTVLSLREWTVVERNAPQSGGRILIADDDADFRSVLVRRARRMGLEVVEAGDGPEARALLEGQAYDALVVDLYMPGATGLEVVEHAQRLDPNVQAIILTASASVETAVEALRAGVYDYMTKPFESMAAFELALTRALEHRHLIEENARLFAQIQQMAVTDPLTGLFNRHKLNESLEMEVERARRYARPLSLIMLDLDDMKEINDSFGHPVGDEALRRVAHAIRSQVRRTDLPTRYGGDEFMIVLPEVECEEAKAIALRIGNEIEKGSFDGVHLSSSAGVAEWKPEFATVEEFVSAVDQSLYLDKGRKNAV
ncbi:MAG: diguanylate cyclase [Chloroflexi bacterium]|nr:diguanylate cyclase [Chloroflexota bacterium]